MNDDFKARREAAQERARNSRPLTERQEYDERAPMPILPPNLADTATLDEIVLILTNTKDLPLPAPDPYNYGFAPSVVADWVQDLRDFLIEHGITLREVLP